MDSGCYTPAEPGPWRDQTTPVDEQVGQTLVNPQEIADAIKEDVQEQPPARPTYEGQTEKEGGWLHNRNSFAIYNLGDCNQDCQETVQTQIADEYHRDVRIDDSYRPNYGSLTIENWRLLFEKAELDEIEIIKNRNNEKSCLTSTFYDESFVGIIKGVKR